MDQGKLQALANSILAVEQARGEGNGLIHPVNVRPVRADDVYPDDYAVADLRGKPVHHKWILMTGGRRTAAHALLERQEIEGVNYADLPKLEQQIIELEENLGREDLTWADELAAKAEIHSLRAQQAKQNGEKPQTLQATAEELGESTANLSRDLQLYNLMRTDPGLAKSSSKRAALRSASHKVEMATRVMNISSNAVVDLGGKLFTEDMRSYVRRLPDQSIALHFPDFPFGIDYDKGRPDSDNMKGGYRDDPENIRDLLADVVPHLVRSVSQKGWIAAMMGVTNYQYMAGLFRCACRTHAGYADGGWNKDTGIYERNGDYCNASPINMRSRCAFCTVEELPWIWFRPNSRQPSKWPDRHANNVYENICIVNGGEARLVRPNVPNVLMFDAVYEGRIHEMQRPHAFCKEVISRLTVTGEKVVDCCFGSGAHLAAAADLGRDFEGCDINPANRGSAIVHVAQYYKPEAIAAGKRGLEGARATAVAQAADAEARRILTLESAEDISEEDLEEIEPDETPELNFDRA